MKHLHGLWKCAHTTNAHTYIDIEPQLNGRPAVLLQIIWLRLMVHENTMHIYLSFCHYNRSDISSISRNLLTVWCAIINVHIRYLHVCVCVRESVSALRLRKLKSMARIFDRFSTIVFFTSLLYVSIRLPF